MRRDKSDINILPECNTSISFVSLPLFAKEDGGAGIPCSFV